MKDRIAKSVFWMTWSRVALQGISLLSTIMVARLLSPTDYGLMALAGIWTGTIAVLAELGLGAAIVQFRDLDDRELNTCFWLTMSLAGLGYAALYMASPVLATWFDSPRLSAVLRVAGLALPLVALRVVPDGLLRRQIALDRVSRAEVAGALVTIPVVLGLAWRGAGVWALVAGSLTAPLIQTSFNFALVRWRPGLQIGGEKVKGILHYSLAILGTRLCWAVYEQADSFVLGKVSGADVLGFYSMAKQLALLPVEKVSGMVNQLATPVMAELQSDREALRATFLKGVRLVAWTAFPLCIGMMMIARDLVETVLTEKWISAVPVIQVLCLYALIRSLAVLLPPVLMAHFRGRFLLIYSAVLLTVMPVAFWIGGVLWGAVGVAIAWLVVYPAVLVSMVREALSEIELSITALGTHLWPPCAATLVMSATVLLTDWTASSWRHDLVVARLTLVILLAVAVYGATLFAYGGVARAELQQLAHWLFRPGQASTAAK